MEIPRHEPTGAVLAKYDLRNAHLVQAYLSSNSPLLAVLERAILQIERVFGPCRPVLDLFQSPEDGGSQKLFVCVPTGPDVVRSARALDDLDESWWRDASFFYGDRVAIDIEPA